MSGQRQGLAELRALVAALPPARRTLLRATLRRAHHQELAAMAKKVPPQPAQPSPPAPPMSVRLTLDLVAALDAAAIQIRLERPWERVTRAVALRVLLGEALAARGLHVQE
jgi:hypothetical protein